MPSLPQSLARAAILIQSQLQTAHPSPPQLPDAAWQDCQRQLGRWQRAHARGWSAAIGFSRRQLSLGLAELTRHLEGLERDLATPSSPTIPSALEIYRDLQALATEFPAIHVEARQGLVVTTEPVELEGIYLGSFEIVLNMNELPEADYSIKACDPTPAGNNSHVHHPHVHDEKLCEGEGRLAIQAALQTGRLLDFFQIVANTLMTYNPESAFVSLADWEGVVCRDCNGTLAEDERYHCERCEYDLCGECATCCMECGDSYCSGCCGICKACEEYFCFSCLRSCQDCKNHFCERCLTHEKCQTCRPADEKSSKQPLSNPLLANA